MKKKGKLPEDAEVKILAIGGDGGTYDIGFQSLSGAFERGHDFTYFCYDNNAYMNTGTQRSSATPRFASATTTPAGTESVGKKQEQKDLTAIMVSHGSPYVAQTTLFGNLKDFHEKAHRAIYTKGPTFVNVLTPCPRGWQYPSENAVALEPHYIFCDDSIDIEDLQKHKNYKTTAAVTNQNVFELDAEDFERRSPRLFFALEEVIDDMLPDGITEPKPDVVIEIEPPPVPEKSWWEKILDKF